MKKYLYTLAALVGIAQLSFAQGTDALPFTQIDRNPVTSALAGAGAASNATAAYSAFANAAMLPFFEGKMETAASYQLWSPSSAKSNNITAGAAYKFSDKFALSLGYSLQSAAAYEVQDYSGQITGTFSPKEQVIALGMGIGLGDKLSLGINARYAIQKLSDKVSFNGFSGDVMLAFAPSDALRFAAGVSTLGNKISSATRKDFSQPAHAVLGAEFAPIAGLKVDAEVDYYFSKNYAAALGAEYCFNEMIYVRAGYRYASQYAVIPSHLGLGLGAKFAGICVDLSYLTASPALGNTINIGVHFSL